jgi:hypothetical protein
MEFKGTKGEWKLDGIGKDLYMVSSDSEVQGNIICIMPDSEYPDSQENWIENAKLIAAAPELLEALKIYLNAGCKQQRHDASVIAKLAIKKALL